MFYKTNVDIPEEFTMVAKTGYPIGFITCNPAAHALFLRKAKTEMKILVGLCVGYDIIQHTYWRKICKNQYATDPIF